MSTDIHQLRSQNSEGAIIGGKRFVELRHFAADAGQPLHQVHLESHLGKVQGGLDSRDASSNDKNIPIHEYDLLPQNHPFNVAITGVPPKT
jgi:hypothetical protein